MSMSKDRVRFILTDNRRNKDACVKAAQRAFGMDLYAARAAFDNEATIICRPSQFARFVIYRSQDVTCNAFQQFKAELFMPEDACQLDVSKNPRQEC